jgi:thymidylate synthase
MIGLVCDVFSFTAIQEFTAVQLGAGLGTYTHQVASMHVNEPDLARMSAILAEPEPEPGDRFPDPSMPSHTSWETIRHILRWEAELRTNQRRICPDDRMPASVSPYWQQVLLLFEAYRQIVHQPDEPIDAATLTMLTPAHRWLVTQ